MKKTIVFLGSKEIGTFCFTHLIKSIISLNFKIIGALSNNRILVKEEKETIETIAKKNNIIIYNSLDTMPTCDILISVQYHEILKPNHIAKAKEIAINLHMAPLPEYRGCNQFSFAIINQETTFGTTIHQLEEGIDNGAILFEKRWKIDNFENVQNLYNKTIKESKNLFEQHIQDILFKRYIKKPQHLFTNRKSFFYYRKDIKSIKKIDLKWDKTKIDRHFRATYFPPFPPPYYIKNKKKYFLDKDWKKLLK